MLSSHASLPPLKPIVSSSPEKSSAESKPSEPTPRKDTTSSAKKKIHTSPKRKPNLSRIQNLHGQNQTRLYDIFSSMPRQSEEHDTDELRPTLTAKRTLSDDAKVESDEFDRHQRQKLKLEVDK